MKKVSLYMVALIAILSFTILIANVYSEDQKPQVDKNKPKEYDPCGDMNCLTSDKIDVKDNPFMGKPKGMDMKNGGNMMMCQICRQRMGKNVMCPMMEKMMKDKMQMQEGPMAILNYADKLQLIQEQKDKIDSIHTTHRKDMIRKQSELEIANIDLESLMKKEEPNITAISEQIKKITGIEAELRIAQIKFEIDIKSVLTKEQQANLKMIKEHERYQANTIDASAKKPETEKKMEHVH